MKRGSGKETRHRVYALQTQMCKAMAHPARLEIVDRLHGKEMSASLLRAELGTSKASLSRHMAQLVQVGIVDQRRDGQYVFYKLSCSQIHEACALMRSVLYRRLKLTEKLAAFIGLRETP